MSDALTQFSDSSGRAPMALDPALSGRLSALARQLRRYLVMHGVARLAVFLLLGALLQFALDYGVRGMRLSMRAALLAMLVFLALIVVWRRILSPLMLRIEAADVAKLVERKFPQLSSILISAVRFASGEVGAAATNSPALMSTVIERAPQAANLLDFTSVLAKDRYLRPKIVLLVAIGIGAFATSAWPKMTRLWFTRNVLLHDTPWPRHTRMIIDLPTGELVGARGDDLAITARHEGVAPDEVEIFYTTQSGEDGRQTMSAVGRDEGLQYRFVFKNAREEFTFYLTGGDDTTPEYQVRLLERPRVEWAELRVTPPVYTRLDPFAVGGAERSAQVLPGSRVSIRIKTNKPLASASLMSGEAMAATAERDDEGAYTANLTATTTATFHFALLDEVGLEDKNPARFSLRLLKDDPPQARLRAPGVGEMITPEAVLPLEMQASDTYGLAKVELRYQLTRETTQDGQIELSSFKLALNTFSESLSWPVSSIVPAVGDRLSIRGSATDFDDVSGPKTTESSELAIRVVTPDELLAELARREHEFRMDFERLIDAQEQLRGRLLSLLDSSQTGGASADFLTAVSSLERRQRGIAGSVNVIRQQFEQVLTELRINQLTTPTIEDRLGGNIVEPLAELARRDLALAGDAIRAWSRDASRETAAQIDVQQVVLLTKLRGILAHMIQWQGYQEAVTMLRDILRLQEELKAETKNRVREEGKGIFDK